MLFPGSRIWYEGSAADLASLTEEIKASSFSGHIVLEFQDSLDLVICVGGEFLKVIEKIGRRLLSTKKYREIWGKCQIKAGRMVVFELPPPLARRLRGLTGRQLLVSGTAGPRCDPAALLAARRAARFTGFLDCASPAGKLLLDYEGGTIVGCHYTEYEGLAWEGFEGFRAWHRGFLAADRPSYFFTSERAPEGEGLAWDELLMDGADQVALPLASSVDRLNRAFGRTLAPGETLAEAGRAAPGAFLVLEGRLEARRPGAAAPLALFGPGSLAGLDWVAAPAGAAITVRAREAARCVVIDRRALPVAARNSPALTARIARDAARLLLARRALLAACREDPRLRDVAEAVAGTIERREEADGEIGAADLFRELTQQLPLSLPQIDAILRRLAALGAVRQAGGRVAVAAVEL